MTTKIIHKKSSVASRIPTASDLEVGEIALNLADKKIYTKDTNGDVIELATSSAAMNTYKYTSTSSQTTFSGSDDASATLAYTSGAIIVTVNGVVYEDGTDYTATNGTSIVFTSGLEVNDEVNIIAFTSSALTTIDYSDINNTPTIPTALTDLSITDGTDGQVLTTDGSGAFTFEDAASPYGDTEVSSHLNTGTANADEILSWDGSDFEWIERGNTFSTFSYIATNGQTTFSGADSNSQTLAYTADKIIVTLNGIVLKDTTDYTATNGTSVVLTSGAQTDQELTVMAFDVFEVANVDYSNISNTPTLPTDFVSAASGGTFSGNVVMTGDLTVDTDTLHVDSTNNRVGIGTTSPSRQLHVSGSGVNTRLRVENTTGSSTLDVYAEDGGNSTLNYSSVLTMSESGTERMRIDSSGDVLIGSTTNVGTGDHKLSVSIGGTGRALGLSSTTTGNKILASFINPNGTVGSIQTSGSGTSYVTSSDYRLKENAVAISDGITRIKQLQPKRFNFIADDSVTVDGFMAHEAQAVVPEAVTGTQDAVDDDGNPDYQGIDQAKLVPLLTAALQEAITKIETLETQNADILQRLETLENNNE